MIKTQKAEIFRDTISDLGLNPACDIFNTQTRQHSGHSVIWTILNIQVCEVKPGPYVLDHLALLFKLNIIKPNAKKEKATFRNLKDVDIDVVFSDLKLEVENYENIDIFIEDLEKKLDELIEKVAPKRQKLPTVSEKKLVKQLYKKSKMDSMKLC